VFGIEEAELEGGIETVGDKVVGFVGEADRIERAADAFGGVFERRGNPAVSGEGPGAGNGVFGFSDKRIVNRNAHALASLLVEDDGFIALVAVFAEDDGLECELHAVLGPHREPSLLSRGAPCL
jgi:hypothetical protein